MIHGLLTICNLIVFILYATIDTKLVPGCRSAVIGPMRSALGASLSAATNRSDQHPIGSHQDSEQREPTAIRVSGDLSDAIDQDLGGNLFKSDWQILRQKHKLKDGWHELTVILNTTRRERLHELIIRRRLSINGAIGEASFDHIPKEFYWHLDDNDKLIKKNYDKQWANNSLNVTGSRAPDNGAKGNMKIVTSLIMAKIEKPEEIYQQLIERMLKKGKGLNKI